jgi:hypothetical protein
LAAELAVKQNEDGIALTAADRARTAADESGDVTVRAAATRSVAIALRRLGHQRGAADLLVDTAATLEADTRPAATPVLTAYASLLCTAAYAASQSGDRDRALDLITEASAAADRTPGAGPFGPAQIRIYRIGIHNALGESGAALAAARSVEPRLLPTAERRARFHVDTARAWFAHGRIEKAYANLCAAEAETPEEVRRPSVRTLTASLLYANGATPAGLRDLAARTGAG